MQVKLFISELFKIVLGNMTKNIFLFQDNNFDIFFYHDLCLFSSIMFPNGKNRPAAYFVCSAPHCRIGTVEILEITLCICYGVHGGTEQ